MAKNKTGDGLENNILFATKDRITGDALQSILNQRGYDVQIQSKNLLYLDQKLKKEYFQTIIFDENVVQVFENKLEQIKTIGVKSKVALILSSKTLKYVVKGLQKGVDGFIHKESGLPDLINCLHALKENCTYISPSLSGRIAVDNRVKRNNKVEKVELTLREKEIMLLVKENKTSREIGEILNISTKTIQNHRQNICNKLGLKGRNKLYEYALAQY